MRDWGTPVTLADEAAADAHLAQAKARLPEVASAYQPSGKLPFAGLAALAGGAVFASIAAAVTGTLVAGIALALFALMGFLVAVIAACGFVACITLVWGVGVAVIGGAATFGGLGWVAGTTTAWAGKLGQNRNATAAYVFSFFATFVGWAAVAAAPVLLAQVVPPSPDDFSVGGLVHLFGDYGWLHGGVLVLGLAFALLMAWVGAEDAMLAQKFCEPCGLYMQETKLPGLSFAAGEEALDAIDAGDGAGAARALGVESGLDLEPTLHRCPRCGAGFFEARGWTRAKWTGPKGEKDAVHDWRAISCALRPELALPLSRIPPRAA
jgi:hypothetical protein